MKTRTKRLWAMPLAALLLLSLVAAPAVARQDASSGMSATVDDSAHPDDAHILPVCDFEDFEPSAEELAEANAETEALVEFLAEHGFVVEVETDEFGFIYPAFTEADEANEALWETVDAFFEEMYEDFEPSAEELAEANAETEALVEFLAEHGFVVEVETDEFGFIYPAFTEADEANEALWETVDAFFEEMYEDFELCDEFDDCDDVEDGGLFEAGEPRESLTT